jgi:hypothetical protein
VRITKRQLRRLIKEWNSPADLDTRTKGQPATQGERIEVARIAGFLASDLRVLQRKFYFDDMVPQERQAELEAHLDTTLRGLDGLKGVLDDEVDTNRPGLQENKMRITKRQLRRIIQEQLMSDTSDVLNQLVRDNPFPQLRNDLEDTFGEENVNYAYEPIEAYTVTDGSGMRYTITPASNVEIDPGDMIVATRSGDIAIGVLE